MKDKTITDAHFEYVNEQVKILGFQNLADFETKIAYSKLKQEQKNICEQINLSIGWFKKLFPQEGFDLRKINYSFENIDQVLGFIKKLFGYLSIQYEYSRIKGIPTLRLIQPNNLYSKFIMNLRNIPQKEFFTLQKENTLLTSNNSNINQSDMTGSNKKKYFLSEWASSTVEPDFITKSKKLTSNDNDLNFTDKINLIDKMNFSEITTDNKKYPIVGLMELFNKFEKINVSGTFAYNDKVNLSLIPIDWINTIKISIINELNKNESLPLGTIISLIIGEDEIILHAIDHDKQKKIIENNNKLKINIPNNFLYHNTNVYLQINLPETNESYGDLTNNLNFKYEYEGLKITNKNIVSEFVDKIILFDNNKLYSGFHFGIYNQNLKIKIKNYYDTIHNQISYNKIGVEDDYNSMPIDYSESSYVQMSYLMGYLKKPFEKKYIVNNELCLKNLTTFDYFNWIKIKNLDKNKLSIGTKIELEIGSSVVLTKEISKNSIFDDENYYKFEIHFPNTILYQYHSIDLKIILPNDNTNNKNNDSDNDSDNHSDIDNDENTNKINSFEIIINGSTFKVSTPKMFFSTNASITYNHNSNWFVPGEKEFISMSGMVGNRHCKYKEVISNDEILKLFKKFQEKNLLTINKIGLDCGITDTCIFANVDLKNDKMIKNKSQYINSLMFLVSPSLTKYFDQNNILFKDTNSGSYSFGSNELIGPVKYELCELTNISTCKIYFKISRLSDILKHDMLKHIDLEFKNFKTNKSDELDQINKLNNTYEFNAWIEHDTQKIYDFGIKNMDKKIRLNCKNKYVSLIRMPNSVYLVIEIPYDKFDDWKNISMSMGRIYSDTIMRRNMVQYGLSTVNVLDK
jgi:hypothetical protein